MSHRNAWQFHQLQLKSANKCPYFDPIKALNEKICSELLVLYGYFIVRYLHLKNKPVEFFFFYENNNTFICFDQPPIHKHTHTLHTHTLYSHCSTITFIFNPFILQTNYNFREIIINPRPFSMFDTCIALIHVCIRIYSRQRISLFSLGINQYNNDPVLYKKKNKNAIFYKT